MKHSTPSLLLLLTAISLATAGCSPSRVPGGELLHIGDDSGVVSDPSCPEARSIVPDITCGSARPEVVCAGSCGQTLDGVVGVGLSTCRCMDTGSGFGGQWVCDTAACDEDPPPPSDAGSDSSPSDSGVPDTDTSTPPPPMCPPISWDRPTTPGCTTAQRYEIMRIETQSQYDAFVADPANADCNGCITISALACATARGCDDTAGELMCCLDEACGDDDTCRDRAFTGACATEANGLSRCVSSISACALNPLAPPAECFP